MKRERRYLPAAELRVQQTDAGEKVIAGYAVVYNSLSEDMGFREMVAPGAFVDDLASDPDVRCFFNHDDNQILGRTASGTLTLTDDERGLFFRCVLPNTTVANDLAVSIERGDVSQCSFGFVCDDAEWSETPDYMLRTIRKARLFDVSPVVFPAYEATSVGLRSLFPDGGIEIPERRDDMDEQDDLQCACECPECQAGQCGDCSMDDCTDPNCRCMDQRSNKLLAALIERRLR